MKRHAFKAILVLSFVLIGALVMWLDPTGAVFNLPGLVVVVCGTFVATVLGQSYGGVMGLLKELPRKLSRVVLVDEVDVELFLKASEFHRQGSVRFAEAVTRQLGDPFWRAGIQQVLDRTPYADLSRVLQWKIGAQRERDQSEIQVFMTMMAFAPAFGMLGTLFGLISMLYGLDMSSLRSLGQHMGFAMLTTVYGLLLANLVLKPIVSRLEQRSRERLAWLHVQQEAILMMHEKCHPRLIQDYLDAYLAPAEHLEQVDELSLGAVNQVS